MNGQGIYAGSQGPNPGTNQRPYPDARNAVARTPLLPLMLQGANQHTQTTAELVDNLTDRLRSICSEVCPEPQSPEMKEEPLPEALAVLRETLRRVDATNKRIERLLRQIEL